MSTKTPPIRRRRKKRDTGMPTGRRITCTNCDLKEQVSFGNRAQAEQAAKVRGLDPRDDDLFCTGQHGKVHLKH